MKLVMKNLKFSAVICMILFLGMALPPLPSTCFGTVQVGTHYSAHPPDWNNMPYMQSTTKIPPGWSEEIAAKYPFRRWLEQQKRQAPD